MQRYQAPRLERFGTFTELTRDSGTRKSAVGNDMVPLIGEDCSKTSPPPTGCVRS
jgi:hypothetical protein